MLCIKKPKQQQQKKWWLFFELTLSKRWIRHHWDPWQENDKRRRAHGYTALDGLSFIFSKTIQEVKFWITSTIDVSSREHRVLLKKVLLYCYPHKQKHCTQSDVSCNTCLKLCLQLSGFIIMILRRKKRWNSSDKHKSLMTESWEFQPELLLVIKID